MQEILSYSYQVFHIPLVSYLRSKFRIQFCILAMISHDLTTDFIYLDYGGRSIFCHTSQFVDKNGDTENFQEVDYTFTLVFYS